MQDVHELRVFARGPKFRLHPVQVPGAHLGIGRMTAPKVDLPGKVFCLNEHGKEQV
jgi:hypothetical protein